MNIFHKAEIRIFAKPELDHLPETRDDDAARRIEKEFLSKYFSLPMERIFFLKQTHKDQSHYIGSTSPENNSLWFAEGDAMYTDQKDMLLVIRTADCIPLFFEVNGESAEGYGTVTVAGIVHAGWRGLKEGIIEKTMSAIQNRFYGKNPTQWKLSMGPAISGEVYQVDSETASYFTHKKRQTEFTNKYLVDLYAEAAGSIDKILKALPVSAAEITGELQSCTYLNNEKYYSHRRGDIKRNLNTIIIRDI